MDSERTNLCLDDLKPSVIYLTDGSLQKIKWFCKEIEIVYLWSPTCTEIRSVLEEYTVLPRSVIIVPRSLKNFFEDPVYGLPADPNLYINDSTYVFIALDHSPQILNEDSKDKQKRLKSKLETGLNGLCYQRLTLNSKSLDITKDLEVKNLIEQLDPSLVKLILSKYSEQPYDLIKNLQSPEMFLTDNLDQDEQEVLHLINQLGTIQGLDSWSSLDNQKLMATFVVKNITEAGNITNFVKYLCRVNHPLSIKSIWGDQKICNSYNQKLYMYLKPILKKIEKTDLHNVRLYLGYFARFALAINTFDKSNNYGFRLKKSKLGNYYLCTNLSEYHKSLWKKNVLRLK